MADTHEPTFDPSWLDRLVEIAAGEEGRDEVHDLYLERRFEVRVSTVGDEPQVEECRSEGTAARWLGGDGERVSATTGTSPRAVADLLGPRLDNGPAIRIRPLPTAELDLPRGWLDWALEVVRRRAELRPVVIALCRRAVVVNRRGWVPVTSPMLVRIQTRGESSSSLLAVAGHADLAAWVDEMAVPLEGRLWRPSSGSRDPVVFADGTGGSLVHELLGHMVEGDLVAGGDSPLRDLRGTMVAPESFDLIDDPTRVDLAGAFDHDDEGIAATPVHVVTAGRLEAFLCDARCAALLGGAPGRGRRASWNRPPVPRMSNLIVAPGREEPQSFERDLRRGLVVTRIGGATVDPLSGRAVIRVERGWEIRGGRRRRPLAGCRLIGSVLPILGGMQPDLGTDQVADWRLGWCVKGGWPLPTGSVSPTMLVHGLEVL